MASTVWGSVDANGNILSGSGDFSVEHFGTGQYKVIFDNGFTELPAVVATQNNYGDPHQYNTDGIVVPLVDQTYCQINTGGSGSSGNNAYDRAFAFIAIGN